MQLKNSPKLQYDALTSAFLKELSRKKKKSAIEELEINEDTDIKKIADIISKKLLRSIEKK